LNFDFFLKDKENQIQKQAFLEQLFKITDVDNNGKSIQYRKAKSQKNPK
jgi:hypothetical protein